MAKLVYDYWFVQFDFPMSKENAESIGKPELAGKPYKVSGGKMVYNEQLKREIPEGWEVKALKKEMDLQYGFPFSTELFNDENDGIPVIRIRDIQKGTISCYSTENVNEKYKLQKGDVVIGMDGNFHINYWSAENCYLNQRCLRIRSSESSISEIQAKYMIEPYIKAKEKNVSRTTVGHLSARDINDLKVIIAHDELQSKANDNFKAILNKIVSSREENQKLAELRDWLLPMLMNGQVLVGHTDEERDNQGYKELDPELRMVAEEQVDYTLFEEHNKTNHKNARRHAQILALAIEAHAKQKRNLYRTKGEKLIEVIEKHLSIEFGRTASKMAAGPADFEYLVTMVEPLAKRNDWFTREKKKLSSGRKSNKYLKGSNFNNFLKDAHVENQDSLYELNRIINLFIELKTTKKAEIVATTYSAWNNLIIRQEEITNDSIINEARENWHEKKLEIPMPEFKVAIEWLKSNSLVPKGNGREVV